VYLKVVPAHMGEDLRGRSRQGNAATGKVGDRIMAGWWWYRRARVLPGSQDDLGRRQNLDDLTGTEVQGARQEVNTAAAGHVVVSRAAAGRRTAGKPALMETPERRPDRTGHVKNVDRVGAFVDLEDSMACAHDGFEMGRVKILGPGERTGNSTS